MKRLIGSLLALTIAGGCSDSVGPDDYYAVWGGEGVRLTLSETQARFETSCWAGEMAIPIQVDGSRLTAIGTISFQGGAGMTETRAVILYGTLDDDELRLRVETSFEMGPYTLHRDVHVEIPGCPITP